MPVQYNLIQDNAMQRDTIQSNTYTILYIIIQDDTTQNNYNSIHNKLQYNNNAMRAIQYKTRQ